MARRGPLRQHLKTAWKQTINGPYNEMLINSERGLQVHFCVNLLTLLSEHERRLFIEPTIVFPDGVRRCPDLVICNSQRIIGVVEFKYTPRKLPSYTKDFATLVKLAESVEGDVVISNERYRGPQKPKHYHVADDAVLCWAAIHSNGNFHPTLPRSERLGERYLELRATTTSKDDAEVLP